MSYFSQTRNTYIDASEAQPVTPMIADIIAIQKLYGVPTDINAGDTVYGYQSNVGGYLDKFFQRWTGEGNPFLDIDVGFNSAPVFVDLDGDDDPDLIVGSHEGTLYYFENTGTSVNPSFMQRTDTANPLDGVYIDSLSTPAFVDLDGDSDPDLVIGSQDGAVHYFGNTGTATNPDFTELTGVANPLDSIAGYLRSVFADLDGDGDLDLVIKTPQHHLLYLENTGTSVNPGFTERTGASNPLDGVNLGSYIEPAFADLDGDGDPDFIIGKDNGDICYYENIGTATNPDFTQRTGAANPLEGVYAGFLSAPVFTDLDGDNDLDLVIGNQDGAIHYFENTGTRANPSFTARSLARPATLTLYDSSGSDTLDLRTDTNNQRVYLRPEGISDVFGLTGNLIIARDTVIENFIAGSGDDLVAGNAVANYLSGRDGDDRLWGSGGDDILEGGAGADRLDGDAGYGLGILSGVGCGCDGESC